MSPGSSWRTVWITGASSGIGLELSRLLSAKTEHLALSARSTEVLNSLAASDPRMMPMPMDVTDANAVHSGVAAIEAACGPIDLVVLSAGAWKLMAIEEFDLDAVRTGVDVNIMGVMNCLDAVLPGMIARRSGHIAIVASVAGYRGLPKSVAYGPTKAALINIAETLRSELTPHDITVTLVNPGFVDTPMTRDNPFPMPGLMSASNAARIIARGLERRRYEIAFPFGFVAVMKLLRAVPNSLFFWFIRTVVHRPGRAARQKR